MSSLEPLADRLEIEVGTGREPATEHEPLGVERVRQVHETERDPAAEVVDHGQCVGVALTGGLLHHLAADRFGVAAGELEHVG